MRTHPASAPSSSSDARGFRLERRPNGYPSDWNFDEEDPMLPDRERHVLHEIEAGLQASDPEFAQIFSKRSIREARLWRFLLILCDVTAVLMLAVGLFARDAGMVLWGTVAAAALVAVHVSRLRPKLGKRPDRPRGRAW